MAIVSLYKNFQHIGGAEKVAVQLHNLFKQHYPDCYIMGSTDYADVQAEYGIKENEYQKSTFKNFLKLKGSTVICHHRKNTSLLVLLNKVLNLNIRIIHVAHNEFFDRKYQTLYPKEIITVSGRVKQNLIDFFGVKGENITVIHNGLPAPAITAPAAEQPAAGTEIRILYGARITEVKGQVRLVQQLKGKLPAHIKIDFAGVGEQLPQLTEIVKDDANFSYIGFIDFKKHLHKYNYFMLFSSNEGLPLSLIEACSYGVPSICNDVGGNLEIVNNGINGFAIDNYDQLIKFFNNDILHANTDEYKKLVKNARLTFDEGFTEDVMFKAYLNYLNKGGNRPQ